MTKLSPYQTYCEYVALKNHFNVASYDYFKYHHKISATSESFKSRADHPYFLKLAKHPEPIKLMLSNFSTNSHAWVGDIASEQGLRIYDDWNKRIQSLSYTFKEEIKQLRPLFDDNIIIPKGTHPSLIKAYLAGRVCLETTIIIVDVSRCYSYWNKNLDAEDIIWQEVSRKITKYKPFLSYSRDKFKTTLRNHFQEEIKCT